MHAIEGLLNLTPGSQGIGLYRVALEKDCELHTYRILFQLLFLCLSCATAFQVLQNTCVKKGMQCSTCQFGGISV